MAEQLMATKGPCQRGEWKWTAFAMSSLPVPLSPCTSTVASFFATRPTSL